MTDIAVIEPLNAVERENLQRYEQTITDGLNVFWRVGEALQAIRDGKLYRETHGTFADYVRAKFGFSDSRARQLRTASVTYKALAESLPVVAEMDLSERAMRALEPFPKEYHPVITDATINLAKNTGRKPSGGMVTRVGEIITRVGQTGTADGATPIDAEIIESEYEATMRQKQHIENGQAKKYDTLIRFQKSYVVARNGDDVTLRLPGLSEEVGNIVFVTVAVERLQAA